MSIILLASLTACCAPVVGPLFGVGVGDGDGEGERRWPIKLKKKMREWGYMYDYKRMTSRKHFYIMSIMERASSTRKTVGGRQNSSGGEVGELRSNLHCCTSLAK